MEINITEFFNNEAPSDYSASVAELGRDAGKLTWAAAQEAATDDYHLLQTEVDFVEFRAWVAGFGAWDRDEIAAWSPVDCNALLIQFIAGFMREAGMPADDFDWEDYDQNEDIAHDIFRADDGQIYFYMGD